MAANRRRTPSGTLPSAVKNETFTGTVFWRMKTSNSTRNTAATTIPNQIADIRVRSLASGSSVGRPCCVSGGGASASVGELARITGAPSSRARGDDLGSELTVVSQTWIGEEPVRRVRARDDGVALRPLLAECEE